MGTKTRRTRSKKPSSSIASPLSIPTIVAIGFLLALTWNVLNWATDNPLGISHYGSRFVDWNHRRSEVKNAFIASWDAYYLHAWGHDKYHPVSQRGSQMSLDGLGWMIIDSLDTMMIMNLTGRVTTARNWIEENLDYNQDQDVNTFETTIRMLGGLLSAHYLSNMHRDHSAILPRDSFYLEKSIDLADRLLSAYNSRSGIPYTSVHLSRMKGLLSHDNAGASSLAEAGSLQLEMKYLSHLTGNDTYWRKAEKAMEVLDGLNGATDGLLPIFIHPDRGEFTTSEIWLGSRGDSYYEYLIKQYLQTAGQETAYLDMWDESLSGIRKHLIATTKEADLKFVGELPDGIGGKLSPKMDHLVCFLPGAIALGATHGMPLSRARTLPDWNAENEEQIGLARDLIKTCWGMYAVTRTGLAPEITWFQTHDNDSSVAPDSEPSQHTRHSMSSWKADYIIQPSDAHNLQRPETVESLFIMWRITGDPIYREWGWKIFKAFEKHTRSHGGYTSLEDVNAIPSPKRDSMESFWLAETLKYLYLLFSPSDFFPLDEVVFNTEAHILPVFQSRWKTGWSRKHRPTNEEQ